MELLRFLLATIIVIGVVPVPFPVMASDSGSWWDFGWLSDSSSDDDADVNYSKTEMSYDSNENSQSNDKDPLDEMIEWLFGDSEEESLGNEEESKAGSEETYDVDENLQPLVGDDISSWYESGLFFSDPDKNEHNDESHTFDLRPEITEDNEASSPPKQPNNHHDGGKQFGDLAKTDSKHDSQREDEPQMNQQNDKMNNEFGHFMNKVEEGMNDQSTNEQESPKSAHIGHGHHNLHIKPNKEHSETAAGLWKRFLGLESGGSDNEPNSAELLDKEVDTDNSHNLEDSYSNESDRETSDGDVEVHEKNPQHSPSEGSSGKGKQMSSTLDDESSILEEIESLLDEDHNNGAHGTEHQQGNGASKGHGGGNGASKGHGGKGPGNMKLTAHEKLQTLHGRRDNPGLENKKSDKFNEEFLKHAIERLDELLSGKSSEKNN